MQDAPTKARMFERLVPNYWHCLERVVDILRDEVWLVETGHWVQAFRIIVQPAASLSPLYPICSHGATSRGATSHITSQGQRHGFCSLLSHAGLDPLQQ